MREIKMIDWNDFHNRAYETKEVRFITGSFFISKNDLLDALKCDEVIVFGKRCRTPQKQLLDCLLNDNFGNITLELEIIE